MFSLIFRGVLNLVVKFTHLQIKKTNKLVISEKNKSKSNKIPTKQIRNSKTRKINIFKVQMKQQYYKIIFQHIQIHSTSGYRAVKMEVISRRSWILCLMKKLNSLRG